MVAIAFAISVVVIQVGSTGDKTSSVGMSVPISDISDKSTLEKAKQNAQFAMKVPTKLPMSSLKEVYVDKDGSSVMVLYSDPNMKSLNHIGGVNIGSATIVLTMGKESLNPIPSAKNKDSVLPMKLSTLYPNGTEKIVGYIPQTPASFVSVTIKGVDGIGFESKLDDVGNLQPATMRWWDNNTLYTLYGYTSVQELVKIAESMQ